MYYRKDNNCDKCNDCMSNPGKDYCNTTCKDKDMNCYESYKVYNPHVYSKATVVVQPYKNLYCINDAFEAGTIFKDLYSPYCDVKYLGGKNK
ncbi:MAG: spore coat associated protein CotJA [Clostridium sp.]|nr:spore coat associated protein CotJA [Clostridium sp.]